MQPMNPFRRGALLFLFLAFCLMTLVAIPPGACPQTVQLLAPQQLARDIFRELIEIDTTHSTGDTTQAAEAMAARLKAAGFASADVKVLGPNPRNRNLVARFRGTGRRQPILLLAHLDVVEARREDWSFDPFKFLERDGYFYGRGTSDVKDGAAILVANLIRYKQEGFIPDRDLILALTAGEESGGDYNGVDWLLKNYRELITASYCINTDGGDPQLKNGKRLLRSVQASEKLPISFRLEVKNPGGHSSLPVKENAIYILAAGLGRLAKFDFPVKLNEVTRAYFERMATIEKGSVAADMKAITLASPDPEAISRLSESPYYNALMRTTCVATQLEAGHAVNALPQTARATVNCRLLPGESPTDVQLTLARVLADKKISIAPIEESLESPSSPLMPELMRTIEHITAKLWPGVPVVPVMETGGTDGLFLRQAGIPTYGVSGVFLDFDDIRAHGKDERIEVRDFYDGQAYLYQLVKALSSGNSFSL